MILNIDNQPWYTVRHTHIQSKGRKSFMWDIWPQVDSIFFLSEFVCSQTNLSLELIGRERFLFLAFSLQDWDLLSVHADFSLSHSAQHTQHAVESLSFLPISWKSFGTNYRSHAMQQGHVQDVSSAPAPVLVKTILSSLPLSCCWPVRRTEIKHRGLGSAPPTPPAPETRPILWFS